MAPGVLAPPRHTSPAPRWGRADLTRALRSVGIGAGDVVYFQVCHQPLGPAEDAATEPELAQLMHLALLDAVGSAGTIIAPSYTFSFCHQQVFDPATTPTRVGPWNTFTAFPEYLRRLPGAVRSCDPIFSNAGVGPRAAELLSEVPQECLGEDSIHGRMRRVGGKICILGVGLYEAIFRHYVESVCRVPWRFDKVFAGTIREHGTDRKERWLYNVRVLAPNGDPAGEALETLARRTGVCRVETVGAGELVAVDAEPYFELASRELARDPWFTARGPAGDPLVIEETRTGGPARAAPLPHAATMRDIVDALWRLPRDLVSNGYDAALLALASRLPMTIHEYPTGTHAGNEIVPEKWTCNEAWLETMDGRRVFSYADHSLHVASYSLPFEGVITREDLLLHLHVHPRLPDAIPWVQHYGERDWGLCCTQVQRAALTDERYRVAIRSIFNYGTLKVGEIVVPGSTNDTILLVCHLGHPHVANDGLSGATVAADVARALRVKTGSRCTYRILFVPHAIGTLAFLSRNEHVIASIKAGLRLDMLGTDHPHLFRRAGHEASEADATFERVLRACDPRCEVAYHDDAEDDAGLALDGFALSPRMASITRALPQDHPEYPYREYHSSADTPETVSTHRLEASRDIVLAMLDAFESSRNP